MSFARVKAGITDIRDATSVRRGYVGRMIGRLRHRFPLASEAAPELDMGQPDMTEEQLRRRLAETTEARQVLYERGRNSHVELARYLAAEEAVLQAERDLAAAKGDQYAVPLDLGFTPAAAVTNPSLQQDDNSAILRFNAVAKRPDGSLGAEGTAEISFALCSITKFGYPNDEALPGHPLYGRGLSPYGIFEVQNSEWDRALSEQNLVSFPNWHAPAGKHLVFSFHDSTFECICGSIGSSRFTPDPDGNSQ